MELAATSKKKTPPSTTCRLPFFLLVAALVGYHAGSYSDGQLSRKSKIQHGYHLYTLVSRSDSDKPPLSSQTQDRNTYHFHNTIQPWSASDLLAHNVSSMFELPPELWSSISGSKTRKCPVDLSFFVYDHLPSNLTTDLEDTIRLQAHKREAISETLGTEWALVQLFRSSPCRTYNPSMADFLVVPYMHYSHCAIHDGYWMSCGHIQPQEFNPLFESLEYYKEKPEQHIFIQVNTSPMLNKRVRKGSHLKLTADRVDSHIKTATLPVPILHDAPNFQPSQLLNQPESYWTRPRKYAFASFYGGRNPRMIKSQNARRFREYFSNSVQEYYNDSIAGMPFMAVHVAGTTTIFNPMEIYQESVLCPVLAGDCCWSRRFFDVIRNGCLPVVLEWEMPNGLGRTWHTPSDHCPLEDTYPFFPQNITRGQVGSVSNLEIDYDAFVVKAAANPDNEKDVSSIYRAMQDILQNPEELAKRQRIMMSYAPLFTFGLGVEAHQHQDAFWRLLQVLEQKKHV